MYNRNENNFNKEMHPLK